MHMHIVSTQHPAASGIGALVQASLRREETGHGQMGQARLESKSAMASLSQSPQSHNSNQNPDGPQ